jgi:hypothetical protein
MTPVPYAREMYSPPAILLVVSFLLLWAVATTRAVRQEGLRVLWVAWMPPAIVVAVYGTDLLMGLACAQGGGCV